MEVILGDWTGACQGGEGQEFPHAFSCRRASGLRAPKDALAAFLAYVAFCGHERPIRKWRFPKTRGRQVTSSDDIIGSTSSPWETLVDVQLTACPLQFLGKLLGEGEEFPHAVLRRCPISLRTARNARTAFPAFAAFCGHERRDWRLEIPQKSEPESHKFLRFHRFH